MTAFPFGPETEYIDVPKSLGLSPCVRFINKLRTLPPADHYVFDFDGVTWCPPFSQLILASEIERFTTVREGTEMSYLNYEHMTYPAHMGFFQAFGLEFGKRPGEASGSSTYIPLTLYNCDVLKAEASAEYARVEELVERKSLELACILAQRDSGPIVDALSYALREIIRNVVEHSESDQFGLCAQYWPDQNRAEVGILDRGIGIRRSLVNNPSLRIANDRDALNLALMPGISSKPSGKRGSKLEGVWAHSGLGLYMTQRICRTGGTFFIVSYEAALHLTATAKQLISLSFEGTALCLSLELSCLKTFDQDFNRFRSDGREIAKRLTGKPSNAIATASELLTTNFRQQTS